MAPKRGEKRGREPVETSATAAPTSPVFTTSRALRPLTLRFRGRRDGDAFEVTAAPVSVTTSDGEEVCQWQAAVPEALLSLPSGERVKVTSLVNIVLLDQ